MGAVHDTDTPGDNTQPEEYAGQSCGQQLTQWREVLPGKGQEQQGQQGKTQGVEKKHIHLQQCPLCDRVGDGSDNGGGQNTAISLPAL